MRFDRRAGLFRAFKDGRCGALQIGNRDSAGIHQLDDPLTKLIHLRGREQRIRRRCGISLRQERRNHSEGRGRDSDS